MGDDEYIHHISIKELIRSALRMRPDRIIVGEVRGDETIDMLQAMNTGHDGSISTGHGNSIREMLFRLETMVLTGMDIPLVAIRQQIASAINIMIHIQKIHNKGRRIIEIAEVIGIQDNQIHLESLYIYSEEQDCLVERTKELVHQQKLRWN
jgi:pilus assembly protein CpaF